MTQLYAELGEDLARRRYGMVEQALRRTANQPGFHGVRAQSYALVEYARARGYAGEVPRLYAQSRGESSRQKASTLEHLSHIHMQEPAK